jgi:hypothetical protein
VTSNRTANNSARVDVASLAEAKHLPADFLRSLSVHDLPKGGVGITYSAADGETIAVKHRVALKATEGSYWPKGQPLAAYGSWRIEAANKAGLIILVEGESDCWALWFHGLPALGLPGSGTARTLEREHVEAVGTVYVHREPDEGGKRFVENVCRRLAELKYPGQVFELRMPEGVKDPADLHAADPDGFKEALRRCIEQSTPLSTHPAAAARPTEGPTGYDIILAYFRTKYDPTFRDGTSLFSRKEGYRVKPGEACYGAGRQLTELLARASDAPRNENGVIRAKLPGFFWTWCRSAWTDLLNELPAEEEGAEVAEVAEEDFRSKVAAALLTHVTLQVTFGKKDDEVRNERRTLLGWCERFAKVGVWGDIRGYQIWCRRDQEKGPLRIAIRQELFGQLPRNGELAQLSHNKFGRLCARYGIGVNRGKVVGKRVVELDAVFIESQTVRVDDLVDDLPNSSRACHEKKNGKSSTEGKNA